MTVNINRTARKAFFIQNSAIGTLDITQYVDNVRAAYSPLDLPRQSVTYMTGTMVLKQTNTNLDFDDRYSSNWLRGTAMAMWSVNPNTGLTRKLPICGTSIILNAQYDLKDTLTIQFGDILTLLTYRTALQTGICIELDTRTRVATAVFNLLRAAGVPVAAIDAGSLDLALQGNLVEPIFVSGNQSYIQVAAQLCSRHGALIFVTGTGVVQAISLEGGRVIHDVDARDIQVYSRRNAPETAIKQALFTFRDAQVSEQTGIVLSNTEVDPGQIGGTRSDATINVDFDNRTVIRNTDIFRWITAAFGGPDNWVLIGNDTITETYESDPNPEPDANPLKTINQCFPEDNARILTRSTDKQRDNSETLGRWLAVQSTALTPSSFSPIVGQSTWENTTEIYTYTPTIGTPTKVTKVTTTNFKIGYISPYLADRQLGQGARAAINETNFDPDLLIPAQRTVEEWVAEEEDANYTYYRTVYTSIPLSNENDIPLRAADLAIPSQTIADSTYFFILTESEEIPNQTLPNFETIPPKFITKFTEGSVTVGGPGTTNGLEVNAEFNLGDYLDFPLNVKELIALETVKQINGRIYSMTVSDDPLSIDPNEWFLFLPTFRSYIREPNINRRNIISVYKMDSPTISINQTEFVIGYIGILEGYWNTDLDDPQTIEDWKTDQGIANLRLPETLPPISII